MTRRTATALLGAATLLFACAGQAAGEDAELKSAWKRAGHAIENAATETGHAFRDVGKAAGRTAQEAAAEVDESTREAREDAAAEGRGLWGDTKRAFADALDGLANALGRSADD